MEPGLRARPTAGLATALALLFSLSVFGGTCTSNAGRVFNGGGGGGGEGGGGGGGGGGTPPREPAPPEALFSGALVIDGKPFVESVGPRDQATGVDVLSPVALWFSESLAASAINNAALGLRRVGAGSVTVELRRYAADRCVVLVPLAPLAVDQEYEVFVSDDLHDLDGERIDPGEDGVVARFHTALESAGLAPQVVAAFPGGLTSVQPNQSDAVVVFSKPVSYPTAITRILIEQLDSADQPIGSAAYSAPTLADAGGRVYSFLRDDGSEGLDLGARLGIRVTPGIEDTEFEIHTLEDESLAVWTTDSFGPPLAMDTRPDLGGGVFGPDAELNLALLTAYPVNVHLGGHGIEAGDTVHVRVTEQTAFLALNGVSGRSASGEVLGDEAAGTVPHSFVLDFTSSGENAGLPVMADGALAISCWIERGGQRSPVTFLGDRVQDLVPPQLRFFGPPLASSAGTFLTDLPEFRPYGVADEAISQVTANLSGGSVSTQVAASPSTDGWWLGPVVSGLTDGQRYAFDHADFEVTLTDAAGNPAPQVVTGRVGFRGFVADTAAVDRMTLQAFDARTLTPIAGAIFQAEAVDGSDFRSEVSALAGAYQLDGTAGRAYTVTVQAPGYRSATFYALDAERASLPLRPLAGESQSVFPIVTLVQASSGDVRFTTPLVLDADSLPEARGFQDAVLPYGFGFLGAPLATDRPTWFGGFYRLDEAGGFLQYGLDPRVIVDPFSNVTATATPELSMVSLDAAAKTAYPASWNFGGFQPGVQVNAQTRLSGLAGGAVIGMADDIGNGGVTSGTSVDVIDELLAAAAAIEGVDPGLMPVDLLLHAVDANGHSLSVRLRDADPLGPNTFDLPTLVPLVRITGLDPQAYHGTNLAFVDSLAGDAGYYQVHLSDGSAGWDLHLPASHVAARKGSGGHPLFPTLDTDPLATALDSDWTMFVEAFHMEPSFTERGFFFASLRHDFNARGRSDASVITR